MDNLTVVVPFWNGQATIGQLLRSIPKQIPVIVVDDHSDKRLPGAVRAPEKGYFSGAVNYGLSLCKGSDVLVLNQDLWFESAGWLGWLERLRDRYAIIGDGVLRHPAWPAGYVQGTFMFLRHDAIEAVGQFNEADYPLWGATCEWQLRAARLGYQVHVSHEPRQWYSHEGRHSSAQGRHLRRRRRYGSAISQALKREPHKHSLFLRTPPAVSVVMPCYNYGRYLEDAVHCLIGGDTGLGWYEPPGQTFQSFEVVIVDDASTDDSWRAAQALVDAEKGIRAIRLPENRGTPGAINAGIAAAFGEYIHILSADDMREPWGLEKLYRACRQHPHSVAYGDIRIFANGERGQGLKLPEYDFEHLLHKNPMPAGTMYSRQAWEETGNYPENMVYGREDWAFNIALGIHGYCGYHVGMSGNLYRREGQNRSLRTGNVHRGEKWSGFPWRRTFEKQLRDLYPQIYAGERPMACCGGRSRPKSKRPARKPALKATRPIVGSRESRGAEAAQALKILETMDGDEDMVWLRYVGGNAGDAIWWGPATGKKYIFGGGHPIGPVAGADAEGKNGLLEMRHNRRQIFVVYQLAGRPMVKPPAIPQAEAERVNPREPVVIEKSGAEREELAEVESDDLSGLPGVGRKTAKRLAEAGYTTFLALALTPTPELVEAAGLSYRRAEAIIEAAQDIVHAEAE